MCAGFGVESIRRFNILGVAVPPAKTYPSLIIHAGTVLARAVTRKLFQVC